MIVSYLFGGGRKWGCFNFTTFPHLLRQLFYKVEISLISTFWTLKDPTFGKSRVFGNLPPFKINFQSNDLVL